MAKPISVRDSMVKLIGMWKIPLEGIRSQCLWSPCCGFSAFSLRATMMTYFRLFITLTEEEIMTCLLPDFWLIYTLIIRSPDDDSPFYILNLFRRKNYFPTWSTFTLLKSRKAANNFPVNFDLFILKNDVLIFLALLRCNCTLLERLAEFFWWISAFSELLKVVYFFFLSLSSL